MKKRLILIFLALTVMLSALTLSACSPSGGQYGPEFTFGDEDGNVKVDLDQGMTIDGVADESVWQGRDMQVWTTPQVEDFAVATIKTLVHLGENGVYFYAESTDRNIVNYNYKLNEKMGATDKTGLQLYLTKGGSRVTDKNCWEIVLACDGTVYPRKFDGHYYQYYSAREVAYAAKLNNAVLDEKKNGTTDGYSVEYFMPYKLLNLDGKPEKVKMSLASVRYKKVVQEDAKNFRYDRNYQWLHQGGSFGNPSTWISVDNGGTYAYKPSDFAVDGDLSDWAGYEGEDHYINFVSVDNNGKATAVDTDDRYIVNRFIKGSDGLYGYVDAKLRKYFTDDDELFWRNTNVEMRIHNPEKKTSTYVAYAANGYKSFADLVISWKCEETDELCSAELPDERLKHVTNEIFIHNEILATWGIDTDDDLYVSWTMRNGKYQRSWEMDDDPATDPDELTPERNETTKPVTLGAEVYSTNLFFYYGTSPHENNITFGYGNAFRVTEKGISPAKNNDEKYTLDGKADEWSDYDGVHAVVAGRTPSAAELAETGNRGDLAANEKKGLDMIARKGEDGIYLYATVRHAKWRMNDLQAHLNSNLAVSFAISSINPTEENNDWYTGREIFFTSMGVSFSEVGMWMSDTEKATKDADGLYTTVIEGFVPYQSVFNGVGERLAKVYNPETGEVKEGYSLRIGVQWRTADEYIASQGRSVRNDWQADVFWALPYVATSTGALSVNDDDCGWRMYYLDENGIHTSFASAKHRAIDGDGSDWQDDYDANAYNYRLENGSEGTSVQFKAMLREDGLYVLANTKMKNFYTCNAYGGNESDSAYQWNKNTYITVKIGEKVIAVTPYTVLNTSGAPCPSKTHGADTVWSVKREGGYYLSTVECFFNADFVCKLLGTDILPERVDLRFEYSSANNDANPTLIPSDKYISTVRWQIAKTFVAGYNGTYEQNSLPVIVDRTDVSELDVRFIDGFDGTVLQRFEGEIIKPIVGVSHDGKELVFGKDYIIEYENNDAIGEATYTITGRGAYEGVITDTFDIYTYDVTDKLEVIVLDNLTVENKAGIIVLAGGVRLVCGVDYDLTYSNVNCEASDPNNEGAYLASVTVTFKNAYSSTGQRTYNYSYTVSE